MISAFGIGRQQQLKKIEEMADQVLNRQLVVGIVPINCSTLRKLVVLGEVEEVGDREGLLIDYFDCDDLIHLAGSAGVDAWRDRYLREILTCQEEILKNDLSKTSHYYYCS